MGKRYGKLPSELFLNADTFDLMVMDVALGYERYINDKQSKKFDQSMFDQNDLINKMKSIRNED